MTATLRGPGPVADDAASRVSWLTGLPVAQVGTRSDVADAVHVEPGALDEALRKRGDTQVADAVLELGA